jgi:uncharacterized protein YcbK (DUF882 family)
LTRRLKQIVFKSSLAWCGLAALALAFGAGGFGNADATGDTRTISMHHVHTNEDITITYKRDGKYDDEAVKKINWFLRDWRRNEAIKMDPRLIDIVWEVWQDVGAKNPVSIVCGYRAPSTNAMLRRRSKGVARDSQHTRGHAMDFFIPGASLEAMRIAGLRMQQGGVGYYPTSGSPFVHLDTGSIRHWPRMNHNELARVFPDGRTVHIPSDGKPLSGYQLALADIERRGNTPSANSLIAAREAGIAVDNGAKARNLLASLFHRHSDDEDQGRATSVTGSTSRNRIAAIPVKPETVSRDSSAGTTQLAAVPLPARRPMKAVEVAGAVTAIPALPARSTKPAPPTPNSIVAARGGWDDAGALRQLTDPGQLRMASIADEPQIASIAYASVDKTTPAAKPAFSGLHFTRKANAAELDPNFAHTLAAATQPAAAKPTKPAAAIPAPARVAKAPGTDDSWLRAVMLAPDLQHYLSATLIGAPDPKELRALMQKPNSALVISFSDDPLLGILPSQFTGEAVVFLETVSFSKRTASLR